MYTIKVGLEGPERREVILKKVAEGQTLLEVFLKNGIDIRHDCGGVCSCSTCHVIVNEGNEYLEEKSKREMDFLKKAKSANLASRLACQCLLLKGGTRMEVIVPYQ